MSVLPPEIIARVKDDTDMVELVGRYVRLQPAGSNWKGSCPFHREKTPSFHVNPVRQSYKCFGCGEGGDAISFLMAIENLTFPEAMETLARSLDIDLAKYLQPGEDEGEKRAFFRANETACELFRMAWHDERLGAAGRDYLAGRGFQPELLDRFDVGWAPGGDWLLVKLAEHGVSEDLAVAAGLVRRPEGRSAFAYFRDRIMFPIRNIARQIAGFGGRLIIQGEPKYLNSTDSPHFNKGRLLYGFDSARMVIARAKTAVLVEGYLDLLALAQAGVANAVATCGTALTVEQSRLLRRGSRQVIVLFDGDKAGRKAAVRACHVCLSVGLEAKVAALPEGIDPADLVIEHGSEALRVQLAEAVDYMTFVRDAVARAGDDRSSLEKGVHQVLSTIAEVPDPIRREYMLKETADLFGLSVELLRTSIREAAHRRPIMDRQGSPSADSDGSSDHASQTREQGADRQERRPSFRTMTNLNRRHIETVLLSYVLLDDTGAAARLLLDIGSSIVWSTPGASELVQELSVWHDDGDGSTPRGFVQQRWHTKDPSYRMYVTDLLERDIPPRGETERAVRESVERLRLVRPTHHS